jgi:nicotinamide mononucleotide transporter
LIACATLGVTSFLQGATGSWILYWVVQMPLQLVGIYNWRKHSTNKVDIAPKSMKWWHFLIVAICIAGFISLFSWVDSLPQFQQAWYGKDYVPPDKYPIAIYISDAGVLVLGIVAMTMMTLRYREQWILWFLLDVCCIVLWSINFNIQILIMSIAALINAIYGLIVWYLASHNKNVQK